MSEHMDWTFAGMSCDKRGCTADIRGDEMPLFEGRAHYGAIARGLGWTSWAGRSRRWYCPVHQPSPGHKMWEVKP